MAAGEFGILHLGTEAPEATVQAGWMGCSANAIVLLVTVVLFIINFGSFLHLLPELLSCLFRSKPNIGLEHNIHSSAERNVTAWILLPAFAMVADRYRLYNPSFLEWLPNGWSLATTVLVILFFLGLRYLWFPFRPHVLHGDISKAAHNALYTCFVGMMCVVIPTACVTVLTGVPDNIAKAIILYETAFFFLLSVIRTIQFLSRQCSGFSTFLYLCALELVPAALIVTSDRLL